MTTTDEFADEIARLAMRKVIMAIIEALADEYGSEPAAYFVTKRYQHLFDDDRPEGADPE